mmetsp:Transcript_19783/g.45142  ORF Transcript_19783/g.45142 Transcript_19783/m.45142 type:complete len:114 (-) Transcript_19783:230-571(-)
MSSTKILVRFDGFGIRFCRTGSDAVSMGPVVAVASPTALSDWYPTVVEEAKAGPKESPMVGGNVVNEWHAVTQRARKRNGTGTMVVVTSVGRTKKRNATEWRQWLQWRNGCNE